MSVLYVMRHGQASFGHADYDRISELGLRQSSLAGQYFQTMDLRFDAAYCGSMNRQQETAEAVMDQLTNPPGLQILPEFNEYDSGPIMAALIPTMIEEDPAITPALPGIFSDRRSFQLIYEGAMRRWITGRYDTGPAETWREFLQRVRRGMDLVRAENQSGKNVLVFTSGGPISAIMHETLGLSDEAALDLTWLIKNASVSSFLYNDRDFSLSTYNSTAHLDGQGDPELITYR